MLKVMNDKTQYSKLTGGILKISLLFLRLTLGLLIKF